MRVSKNEETIYSLSGTLDNFYWYSCNILFVHYFSKNNYIYSVLIYINYLLGCGSVSYNIVQDFIINHKKLRFLGLLQMDNCGFDMFTVSTHPLYNPNLIVSIIYVFIIYQLINFK